MILKNFGALRALVRKREDLLSLGGGGFRIPPKNGFPFQPIVIEELPQMVATRQKTDHSMVWGLVWGTDHSMVVACSSMVISKS